MGPRMERFKRWFFLRYRFTRQSILCTFLAVAIFALTLYFMNVMANVASYLSPDNTKVPKMSDRLFEAIPSIKLLWLTDLADALLFVPTIILVLTHYRPLYLLCKVLLTWALCNLMRITTIAITSFPDPRDGCVHSVDEFFTTFLLHRCGDCMFSGHTVIFVISALVWTSHGYHRFPRRFRWLAWISLFLVWALCFGSAIIVIANRAHYTVDVMVAFYVAGGNWYIFTYLFDHYIEERGRLKDLTRPWGDGPDPRQHAQEREEKRQLRMSPDAEKSAMAAPLPQQTGDVQMQSLYTETEQPSNNETYYNRHQQGFSQDVTQSVLQQQALLQQQQQPNEQQQPHEQQQQLYQQPQQSYQQEQPYQQQQQEQPMQLPGEIYNHPYRQ
ncbi:sphingomyelin synthase [Linnemannia exigua]|uniref:Sphingomyelin synthase n=1 Tax=Linnemannia exigua TaxID=604196 RepID=A0AAD4DLG0_9FUNG|nr:sphingomyelin synthase [Linnemannia exigua]